jgi:ketosteroid isomerase-like protein
MSQQNVEVIQLGYEHFVATGDFREEIFHPDFVWDMSTFRDWPERQTYAGLEGAREFMRDWWDAWEDWELEVEELLDAGESVVAILRQRGRSKATGLPTNMHFAMVWEFSGGKQVRMRMYASPDEALKATGLTK